MLNQKRYVIAPELITDTEEDFQREADERAAIESERGVDAFAESNKEHRGTIVSRKRANKRVLNSEIGHALLKTHGNITATARTLGVCPITITSRLNKFPWLDAICRQARDKSCDNVRVVLYEKAMAGDVNAIKLWLTSNGGYDFEKKSKLNVAIVDERARALASLQNLSVDVLEKAYEDIERMLSGGSPSPNMSSTPGAQEKVDEDWEL